MKNELAVDSFFLDADQKEDVQRLAALGYSPQDIAIYMDIDPEEFCVDAYTEGTSVNMLIRQGVLVSRANPEMKLHALAESGDLKAIQELERVIRRKTFEQIISDLDDAELS